MEPMRVTVHEVQPLAPRDLWVATVHVRGRERIAGAPVVTMVMQVRFRAPRRKAPPTPRTLHSLARDEALRFLDIA